MPFWPFKRRQTAAAAEALLTAVIAASRKSAFFGEGRIPDTLEGRFELLTLNASLALVRLKADPAAAELAQLFTDKLFRHVDAGLREAGVGDLAVPKKIRKMAGDFYGRLDAYSAALARAEGLAAALGRNMLGDEAAAFAPALEAYAKATARRQADSPVTALATADAWNAALG